MNSTTNQGKSAPLKRRGWLPMAGAAWVIAASMLLLGCTVGAEPGAGTASTSPTASASPTPAPDPRTTACDHGSADPRVGVFRETNRKRIATYQKWLGCRVDYVVDFSSRDNWFNISNPGYLLDEWEGMDRRLVLSVAMLPKQTEASFVEGARGDYDEHYRELAERLVNRGMHDTVLRIGWEFNLVNSVWYTEDVESFRAYFRNIVQAMRSVPGQEFEFTWNLGRSGVDAVPYYPGDDVVDHIGVDLYDATGMAGTYPYPAQCDNSCRLSRQTKAWNDGIYGGTRGLRFWAEFARSRNKPLALPEWGLWDRPDGTGGAANEFFIRKMHQFISDPANNVAYHAYFEFDGADGAHRLMTTFADVGQVYRQLFSPLSGNWS